MAFNRVNGFTMSLTTSTNHHSPFTNHHNNVSLQMAAIAATFPLASALPAKLACTQQPNTTLNKHTFVQQKHLEEKAVGAHPQTRENEREGTKTNARNTNCWQHVLR
jgi:hypothetical protein